MLPNEKNIVQWLLQLFPGVLAIFVVSFLCFFFTALAPFALLILLALVVLNEFTLKLDLLRGISFLLIFAVIGIPLDPFLVLGLCFLAWLLPMGISFVKNLSE